MEKKTSITDDKGTGSTTSSSDKQGGKIVVIEDLSDQAFLKNTKEHSVSFKFQCRHVKIK
jgi:hypothetical protein